MNETFDITASLEEIEIGARGVNEVIQNIKTILSTVKYTVPLHRDFGIDPTYIDAPAPASRALFTADVVRAIKEHEPRAEVVSVLWSETKTNLIDGVLVPVVRIRIKEGVTFE